MAVRNMVNDLILYQFAVTAEDMRTSAFLVSVLNIAASITVIRHTERGWLYEAQPLREKISIGSLEIKCNLNDILIISAPESKSENVLYYLTQPDGDTWRLNVTKDDYCLNKYEVNYDVNVKAIKPAVSRKVYYKILKKNSEDHGEEEGEADYDVNRKLDSINSNEFAIGPILPEHHGNWILSVYVKDEATKEWVEFFLALNVMVIEPLPILRLPRTIKEGSEIILAFAYPVDEIETCELIPPATLFERLYQRTSLKSCSYIVKNVTLEDTGLWKLIGTARIIYTADIHLKVVK